MDLLMENQMAIPGLCSDEEVDRRILKLAEHLKKLAAGKVAGFCIDDTPGNLKRYKDSMTRLVPEIIPMIEYEGNCEIPGVTLINIRKP